MKKVLAVASGGGHWKQLLLISPAFTEHNVRFVTTIEGLPQEAGISDYKIVTDSNKSQKLKVLITFIQVFIEIIKFRPDVIITTGAAPGLLALMVGRLVGAKTIWVDSIANGEVLSMGGKFSKKFAHVVLSQWKDVAESSDVEFKGSVF